MNRNPRNTAVFLLALFPQPSNPTYRNNLCKTIKLIQGLGFEPYLVTPHDELLEDCNLFIKVDLHDTRPIIDLILEYKRDYNLILWDNYVIGRADMDAILCGDSYFSSYHTKAGCNIGYSLNDPGRDWGTFLRGLVTAKGIGKYTDYMVIVESALKLEFTPPCPTTTP